MSGDIGKLAGMFSYTSVGIVGCHFEENSSIHHNRDIRSPIHSCFQWENGVRFHFQMVQ